MDTEIKRAENSHIWQREEFEHYVEPRWCSKRLFDVEKFDGFIHDPCCGFGYIPSEAAAAGYGSMGSDIVDRTPVCAFSQYDFLKVSGPYDNIVCNPPFDEFQKFALHALKSTKHKVAMIWLVRTLNAARWLQQTPLKRILFLTPRPSMPPGHVIASGQKPGGGKQDFCWLIWDHEFKGEPTIGWLHRDKNHKLL